MRKLVLIALVSILAARGAWAQEPEPRHVRPVPVSHPRGGNGAAMTWDGRVLVTTRNTQGSIGWTVAVLRPERIGVSASGVPDFMSGAFSDEVLLELDGTAGTAMGDHNALGFIPAPGFAPNPFPSNADGAADPGGAYQCYELVIFTQDYDAPGGAVMGERRGHIVIANPNTPDATVAKAEMLSSFQGLTTTSGQPLRGIEPTLAFDGQLFIWQGSPANDGSIDRIVYSFNQTPGQASGWSMPRSIADMYFVDRATPVGGIAFQDRYPIAAQQLRASDGTPFNQGDDFHGAYPWISHDGTELFFISTVAGTPNVNRARRGFESVIGRWTGYAIRSIDGPINPDRETTVRLFVTSPGATPSFWRPYRGLKGLAVPYTGNRPVFPILGSNTAAYDEVSFEDWTDKDYLLALRMNECIKKDGTYDTTHTPDTSGNLNTGVLEGARFPQEYDGTDNNNLGALGQAIYFGDGDRVRVPNANSLCNTPNAVTVQLFVKRLSDLHVDGQNNAKFMVNKPGSWNVILEDTGQIQASVETTQGERRSGPLGALPVGQWTNVAFTYDGASGTLTTYVSGVQVGQTIFGAGAITTNVNDLLVGPGGQTPAVVPAGQAIVMLDELLISDVVRQDVEIARGAYVDLPAPAFANGSIAGLAPGLDPADLRVPASNPFSQDAADLGALLFFDPRLSGNGKLACATCHDPGRRFTDGLAKAQGMGGKTLTRNTPTLVNRALSTAQFLDGRAASLEDQALKPILNPDEMGGSLNDIVNLLNATPDYANAFQKAFGAGPSSDTIARAIASFERTIVSGQSNYEVWIEGQGGLGASEVRGLQLFNGRARCVTCHSGSNFTDESFHNTAQTDGSDDGREAVTGRAKWRGAFKTPTLRDVALTGPYLHDGSAPTIEAVIDLYNLGGKTPDGRDVELRPLGLSDQDKADLAAFLRALTGSTVNVAAPGALPGGGAPAPSAAPPAPAAAPPAPAAPAAGADRLLAGGTLQANQSLRSQDGRWTLVMQGDGNLVLYDASGNALWSSGTATNGASFLAMQGDGNAVVYRLSDNTPTWSSKTAGQGSSSLVLQNDANLVIYRDVDGVATWSSGTAR
jgi:cytochrome c peroxidase